MSLLWRIAAAVFSAAMFHAVFATTAVAMLTPRRHRAKSVVTPRSMRAQCRGPPARLVETTPHPTHDRALAKATHRAPSC